MAHGVDGGGVVWRVHRVGGGVGVVGWLEGSWSVWVCGGGVGGGVPYGVGGWRVHGWVSICTQECWV